MRTVKELMRNTDLACKKEDNLNVVACRMFLSDFMFLPVIDDDKKVIAVIYYKEVINALEKAAFLKINLKVGDIMKVVPGIVVHEDEAAALNMMRSSKSSYLPVVDADNHLQGVISFMVLARRIVNFKRNLDTEGKPNFKNFEISF